VSPWLEEDLQSQVDVLRVQDLAWRPRAVRPGAGEAVPKRERDAMGIGNFFSRLERHRRVADADDIVCCSSPSPGQGLVREAAVPDDHVESSSRTGTAPERKAWAARYLAPTPISKRSPSSRIDPLPFDVIVRDVARTLRVECRKDLVVLEGAIEDEVPAGRSRWPQPARGGSLVPHVLSA